MIVITICFSSHSLFSQETKSSKFENDSLKLIQTHYEFNNIIKINTLALNFGNASVFYERAINNRFSFSMGIGYKYSGVLPHFFKFSDDNIESSMDNIKGYSFAPEFRYYLKSCDDNIPSGFYVGLYFKYTKYKTVAQFEYTNDLDIVESYTANIKLRDSGYGLQIGYQLPISRRFIVDFSFFGPRYSALKLTNSFDSEISDEFISEFEDAINKVIDRFGSDYDFELKQQESRTISYKAKIPNFRFGISLGYSF